MPIVAHATADREPAGQQGRPARRAHARRRVELRKLHALGRHPIQLRCVDRRMPVARQVTVTQVIGEQDHKVRRVRRLQLGGEPQGHNACHHANDLFHVMSPFFLFPSCYHSSTGSAFRRAA